MNSFDTICVNILPQITSYDHYDPNSDHHHLSPNHPPIPMGTDYKDTLERTE